MPMTDMFNKFAMEFRNYILLNYVRKVKIVMDYSHI